MFLIGRQSAAKLPLDGLDFQQRQSALAVLPADQRGPLVGQRCLERFERCRLALGHLFDDLGRNEEISRQAAAELRLQRGPQRARRDQRQVEQPGFGRVEILAGLMEPIERRLEMPPRRFNIALEGFIGCLERRGLQRSLVEVAHVAELPRQQFNLQVTEAQGEKVGRQIGVDVRPVRVEAFQGGGQHVVAVRQVPQHACPGRLGLR